MKYTSLLIFSLLLLFTNCYKEATLPPITNTGANVLACKVNGKVVIVSGSAARYGNPIGVAFIQKNSDGLVTIYANNDNPRCEIILNFIYHDTTGIYPIITNYPEGASYDNFSNGSVPIGSSTYNTDSSHTGYIKVLNYSFKQISGTFAYDAINDEGKVIHITEGRFDIAGY